MVDIVHNAEPASVLSKRVQFRPSLTDRLAQAQTAYRNLLASAKARHDRRNGLPWLREKVSSKVGYRVDFDQPRTLNEKINWRKLNQRPAVFQRLSDKLEVRAYVAERLGLAETRDLFPPLLAVTRRPELLRFDMLPANIVLKCTHASGWNILIREAIPIDHALAVHELRLWLLRKWSPRLQEWAYDAVPRQVVVERMLFQAPGDSAWDMKLHCFGGTCRMIEYHTGHFKNRRRYHLGPDFAAIEGISSGRDGLPERPGYNDDMISLAERLAAPFDYLRVDFLTTAERYYLNELTVYPSSGLRRYKPEGADLILGGFWTDPKPM